MTMNANTSSSPTAAALGAMAGRGLPPSRRVTDLPTRVMHWLLAACFTGAWITAESEPWRLVHVTLGYTMAGLLAFRIVYGLVGPQGLRWAGLWRRLSAAPAWVRGLLQHGAAPNWRQGQNLAMLGATTLLLLATAPLVLSGYAVYQDWGGEWLEEVHEFFGNLMLAGVLLHLGLLLLLSLLRRQNQALPMLSGRVPGAGPDLVRQPRAWLALLLLGAVLAFWGWQWQQAPQGAAPAGSSPGRHERHERREHGEREGHSLRLNTNVIVAGTRPSTSLGSTSALSIARSTASSYSAWPVDLTMRRPVILPSGAHFTSTVTSALSGTSLVSTMLGLMRARMRPA